MSPILAAPEGHALSAACGRAESIQGHAKERVNGYVMMRRHIAGLRLAMLTTLLGQVCAAPAAAQTGGPYSLGWSNVGPGQTFANGGAYRLGGTSGQPDAVDLAGGAYALSGGFWWSAAGGNVAVEPTDAIPVSFSVRPAAPNPFQGTTTLAFSLPSPGRVRLAVYDGSGRVVRVLVDEPYDVGHHRSIWDGRDGGGRSVAPGIYFVRLAAGEFTSTQRIIRLQ